MTDPRSYHRATAHSWESVRADQHFLDWEIQPNPFKLYRESPVVSLASEIPSLDISALEAVARVHVAGGSGRLDLPRLAAMLFFSAGLTKKRVSPTGEPLFFRAAASTGALYEVEVYVVAGPVVGLEPGVYHFSPAEFGLRRLRSGDFRDPLARASSDPDRVRRAPASFVLSAIYWRNAWKYRARAFRHFFWDAGTMLANLLATAVAVDVPARILVGFADADVNRLLGLDVAREGALAVVPLGDGGPDPPSVGPVEPITPAVLPLSPREVDYPLVREAYAATAFESGLAARNWREQGRDPPGSPSGGPAVDHALAADRASSPASLGQVILRRGSTRQFAREPVSFPAFSTIVDTAVRTLPVEVPAPALTSVQCYVLAHAVEGLDPGAVVYDATRGGLRRLRTGEFRAEGGYLCLEQALGADASAVVFFLADLEALARRLGNRSYRLANLIAGLFGGRMYLAAYALGLGASGLTFYDDDVIRFFSPDATGKDAIFVTAMGRSHRTRRSGLPRLPHEIVRLDPGQAGEATA